MLGGLELNQYEMNFRTSEKGFKLIPDFELKTPETNYRMCCPELHLNF